MDFYLCEVLELISNLHTPPKILCITAPVRTLLFKMFFTIWFGRSEEGSFASVSFCGVLNT